jgi:hypothetical protein
MKSSTTTLTIESPDSTTTTIPQYDDSTTSTESDLSLLSSTIDIDENNPESSEDFSTTPLNDLSSTSSMSDDNDNDLTKISVSSSVRDKSESVEEPTMIPLILDD